MSSFYRTLLFCAVLAGLWLAGSLIANAADRPTLGIVFNTEEASALTYSCAMQKGEILECTFTQARVRKKAKPEELPKTLAKAEKEFASLRGPDDCNGYQDLVDALEGRKTPPKPEALAKMHESEKKDLLTFSKAYLAYCRSPTKTNYLEVVRIAFSKDCRSCVASANQFSQKFRRQSPTSWIVISQPSGQCGFVQLDRFESETSSGITFWNYFARKAVTNPNATSEIGLPCKEFDERQYRYDWRSREIFLGCDYLEFGP